MQNDARPGIEDTIRRNVAELRARVGLTQQGLADEMHRRGVSWTRETVAQAETGNRRLGLTEAIALSAALDVPLARLVSTSASSVGVGENAWTAAYLTAAVAGTAGDAFTPEAFGATVGWDVDPGPEPTWEDEFDRPGRTETTLAAEIEVERRRRPRDRDHRRFEAPDMPDEAMSRQRVRPSVSDQVQVEPDERTSGQHRTAERIQRRLRMRVTAEDIDATAHRLWSRSLEEERSHRVDDRYSLTGGSLPTIRGHVSRELDRELEHELSKSMNGQGTTTPAFDRQEPGAPQPPRSRSRDRGLEVDVSTSRRRERVEERSETEPRPSALSVDEAVWEATRLNTMLANKGYHDSEVTRWWNFTAHDELGGQTISEAWRDGRFDEVRVLIEALPERDGPYR